MSETIGKLYQKHGKLLKNSDDQTGFNKATDCVICREYVKPYTGAYTRDGFLAHKARRAGMKDCYSECPDGVRLDRAKTIEPDIEPEPGSTAATDKWSVEGGSLMGCRRIRDGANRWVANTASEDRAREIVAEHNQHAALVAERERLLRLLRPVTSPTSCYCAVMKDEKCWHCEARELIAAVEQGGER